MNNQTLQKGMQCIPYHLITRHAAPSTGVFIGNSPKGCGRDDCMDAGGRAMQEQLPMPHFARRTRMSFLANPDKNDGAQEASCIGRISFGYLSLRKIAPAFSAFTTSMWLVRTKKSISSVGTRTHIKIIVALATPYCVHPSTSSGRTFIIY
jgi:hypothetical protein